VRTPAAYWRYKLTEGYCCDFCGGDNHVSISFAECDISFWKATLCAYT